MNDSTMMQPVKIQFRTKTLLLIVAIVGLLLAYPAWLYQSQARLISYVSERGGRILYQCEIIEVSDDWSGFTLVEEEPWLVRMGLANYLSPVRAVWLPLREGEEHNLSVLSETPTVECVTFVCPRESMTSKETDDRIRQQLKRKGIVVEFDIAY